MKPWATVRGKRERVAQAIDRLGISAAITALHARIRPTWLTVLTYHRVGTWSENGLLRKDDYDATEAQFDAELAYLKKYFRFVSSEDVIAFLDGAPLPPNPVMLTFDDGCVECVTAALPLLTKHGATATFFIATDYVEQRKPFWWDVLAVMLDHATDTRFELTYPHRLRLETASAYGQLTDLVKTYRGLDLERFLDHVAESCGASGMDHRGLAEQTVMTWDQVVALRDAGMDIQSHTCSHRVLQTIDGEALRHELVASKALLEERLNQPVRAVAYPVGYRIVDESRIPRALADAGYLAGFTNATGPILTWGAPNRFDLGRLSHGMWSAPVFRTTMALPMIWPIRSRELASLRQVNWNGSPP